MNTAATFIQRDAATFVPLKSRAPTFAETVKEGDNYGDSSLQFVFRAQLISGEREREREGEREREIILQRFG